MKLYEILKVTSNTCIKIVGFEFLDYEEYEIACSDGKHPIPRTFEQFDVVEIDTETDAGETYLKIRVDTTEYKIDELIFHAYYLDTYTKAEIRDQDGDLVDSVEIPYGEMSKAIDGLHRPVFKTGFEAVRDADGILEFTIYREEK